MFGRNKPTKAEKESGGSTAQNERLPWYIVALFILMMILSIAELGFTLDSFIYLTRTHKWWSGTEKARLGFLIFSAVRTIVLAAVYSGISQTAQKWFHTTLHTLFLFLSTVFWIVSGALIHHMWGYKECNGVEHFKNGVSECHEIKIIEILAWVIAAVSVIATVPVVMFALARRKRQAERKMQEHEQEKGSDEKTSTGGERV